MTVTFEGECVLEYTTLLGASRTRWLFRATRLSSPSTTTPSVEWKKCLVLMLTTVLLWQKGYNKWEHTGREEAAYLALTCLYATAISMGMSRIQSVSLC
jgi:hypothetical protein